MNGLDQCQRVRPSKLNVTGSALDGTQLAIIADYADVFLTDGFIALAVCVPDSCRRPDVLTLARRALEDKRNLEVDISERTPSASDANNWSTRSLISVTLLSTIVVAVITCSLLDQTGDDSLRTTVTALSIRRNFRKLFKDSEPSDINKRLMPLNAMRILMQYFAVTLHLSFSRSDLPFRWPWFRDIEQHTWSSDFFYRVHYGTQQMIALSGFVTAVSVLPLMIKGHVPFFGYAIKRLSKIMPVYIFAIIAHHLYWNMSAEPIDRRLGVNDACDGYWWYYLLIFHNYGYRLGILQGADTRQGVRQYCIFLELHY